MICPQRFVGLAARRLEGPFLTAGVRDGVVRFAAGFSDAASAHILECSLANGPGDCDYSLALTRGDDGFGRFVSGFNTALNLGLAPALLAQAGELAIAEILWLEFDADAPGGFGPPSFFVAARALPVPHATAAGLSAALFRATKGAGEQPNVRRLLDRLPQGIFLKQSGVMAGRRPRHQQIRLVLDGVDPTAIPAVLSALEWPGAMASAQRLTTITTDLAGAASVRLDLDLGAELRPELGIEIPGTALQPNATARLAQEKLCSTSKANALDVLAVRHSLLDFGAETMPLRVDFGLNHVKLVAGRNPGEESAKAYFSLITIPDFSRGLP